MLLLHVRRRAFLLRPSQRRLRILTIPPEGKIAEGVFARIPRSREADQFRNSCQVAIRGRSDKLRNQGTPRLFVLNFA